MISVEKKKTAVGIVALLVAVGALVYWGQYRRKTAERRYSGTIEATEANLSFQMAGRVASVAAEEGLAVRKGAVLASLEKEAPLAALEQARAQLDLAEKSALRQKVLLSLNQALKPAEVERAEAAVQAVEAELKQQRTGYRPQEVESGRLAMEAARAVFEEARRNKERVDALFAQNVATERDKDVADVKYETAEREFARAKEAYAMLKEGFRSESVAAARARRDEADALVKLARANLGQIDVSRSDLEAAGASVRAARAAVDQAAINLAYTDLVAPFDGIVVSRSVEPGEVVTPGREVLALADLSEVDLKIFVPETEIGRVRPGQPVRVRIDTFPERDFEGRVAYVSPEAEFTPKIIQTQKERVKLVFLVKIRIPNPELSLKTGMPADAWIE